MKQWLMENKSGMYSKTMLNENALLDAETLAGEIAKQHPEIIRYHHDGDTRKFQDAIFKYAGEILQAAGIPLQIVRGLAYDADWAMDLVSGTKSALENSDLEEINPTALGAPQAAADARMQQQDDENGDMVDNASMDVMAEEPEESIGVVPSVDKVRPAESGIDQYLAKLDRHDWYHAFSDDMRAWDKGQAQKEELKKIYQSLNDVDKQTALDAFKEKYMQIYKPEQFPTAEKNIKYLTTTSFNGFI